MDGINERRDFMIRTTQLGMVNDEYVYILFTIRRYGFGQATTGSTLRQIFDFERNETKV